MDKNKDKAKRLMRRQYSVRKSLFGTVERPRLSVYRSSKHIYAQVINDFDGKTLAAASSALDDVRGALKNGGNIAAAEQVGKANAGGAKAAGGTAGAVDRGGRKDHGRGKGLAGAAREG